MFKRIISIALVFCFIHSQVFAAWDAATNYQTLTVSAAVAKIQDCLLSIDGSSDDPVTTVHTKNLKLRGATSGDITLTPAATAGTTAITVPAVAGTLVTSAGAGADIDIGTYSLTANTLVSDVATGTAPFTVSSTTKVTNLNSDQVDGVSLTGGGGYTLPSGAVFFMITGDCPSGTTDVSATYANKFVKINATAGTSSGTVLTGTSDSHTLTTTEMPAHTHTFETKSDPQAYGNTRTWGTDAAKSADITTTSTGGGGGHTHTLSSATTLEPSSITMKCCQIN